MTDWLLSDDEDQADDLYSSLDEPAMPDAAPAPPGPPAQAAPAAPPAQAAPAPAPAAAATATADASDDWLDMGGGTPPAQQQPAAAAPAPQAAAPPAGSPPPQQQPAPAMSTPQGGTATMAPPAPVQAAPQAAPMEGDLTVQRPLLQEVAPATPSVGGMRGDLSDLVLDVEVQVEVGLGTASLSVEEFLEMGRGTVVELDTPIEAPIELKVRGRVIARGQLVSVGGSYGMRIAEMVEPTEGS